MLKNNVAIVAFIALLFLPATSIAANYFVATTGNNSNAGTSVGTAWLTIQKAADTMAAGDTVTVSAGTYAARVSISISGSAGNPITYLTSGTVVTKGFEVVANYVTVNGFEIASTVDGSPSGPGVYLWGSNNIILNNNIHDTAREGVAFVAPGGDRNSATVANNTVKGNTILRAGMAGIELNGRNSLIESNDISHTIQFPPQQIAPRGGDDADGMRFFGSGHTVRKNYIHDILPTDAGNTDPHTDCFQTWAEATNIVFEQNICHGVIPSLQIAEIENFNGAVSNLTFRNNIFYNATRGITSSVNPGTTIPGLIIVNNVFKNTFYAAVNLVSNPNAVIKNNLFYNVGTDGVAYIQIFDAFSTNLQAGTNAHYMSTGSPTGSPYPGDVWNINPQVVDAANNNFHLLSTSPLINVGTTLTAVTNDYESTVRPQGSGYDIGAFEFSTVLICQ